jgi:hypothetical protein
MIQNRIMRIYIPNAEEVTSGWAKLDEKEAQKLYFPPVLLV